MQDTPSHPSSSPWSSAFGQEVATCLHALDLSSDLLVPPDSLSQSIQNLLEDTLTALQNYPQTLALLGRKPAIAKGWVRLAVAAPFLLRRISRQFAEEDWVGLCNWQNSGVSTFPTWHFQPHAIEQSKEQWMRLARLWKYRNLTHILLRDLLQTQSISVTCRQLSLLADRAVGAAWGWSFAREVVVHGVPITEAGQVASGLVVAMGKWGGKELNFSSDIDLIFAQQGDPTPCRLIDKSNLERMPTCNDGRSAEFWPEWDQFYQSLQPTSASTCTSEAFFNRVGKQLQSLLTSDTADGFMYRTDPDLRPMGRNSMLVPTLAFLESYYQSMGREWERVALIKSRVLIGTAALRRTFTAITRPFTYRRYLDFGMLESIAMVKHQINLQHPKGQDNIKLGQGGIRENEFWVQGWQLLQGGHHRQIRVANHQQALNRLVQKNLISPKQARQIRLDYWRLRKVENRIQMLNESQVHTMPTEPQQWLRIMHRFHGKLDGRFAERAAALQQAVERSKQRNHAYFNTFLVDWTHTNTSQWREVFNQHVPTGHAAEALVEVEALFTNLMHTREGERCAAKLTHLLCNATLYRQGTQNAFVLWLKLLARVGNRNALYAMLVGHQQLIKWVSELFAEGGQLGQLLVVHAEWLETFFDVTGDWPSMINDLRALGTQVQDEEPFLLSLQQMKAKLTLHCLTRYLERVQSSASQTDQAYLALNAHRQLLSELAEVIIQSILQFSWKKVASRFGVPTGLDPQTPSGFAVLGLGKLGTRSMGFQSDLDLMFVHQNGENSSEQLQYREFYTRLAKRLSHYLTASTQFGYLYEVDHRLRPFSDKGVLVQSEQGYDRFMGSGGEVSLWQRMAFVNLRWIAGDEALADHILQVTMQSWQQSRQNATDCVPDLIETAQDMQARLAKANLTAKPAEKCISLKYDKGGLVDVEFLWQVYQLATLQQPIALPQQPVDWKAFPELAQPVFQRLQQHHQQALFMQEYLALQLQDFDKVLRDEWIERLPLLKALIKPHINLKEWKQVFEGTADHIDACYAALNNRTKG